jgi:hypothetical protein
MTKLCNLPDEILLYVIAHYETIRSDESQSQAFQNKDKEKTRQRENRARQQTLYALCLTCKRLNNFCTPFLYASFFGATTLYGSGPLQSFSRTISANHNLAKHIQYVENRLSDFLGHSLDHDLEDDADGAEDMLLQCDRLLGTIIRMSVNLQELSVVSIDSFYEKITLWDHIFKPASNLQDNIPIHHWTKLEQVTIQTNAIEESGTFFSCICPGLILMPSLSVLRASGIVDEEDNSVYGSFKNLRSISLTESAISLTGLGELLLACDGLEHLTCRWEWLEYVHDDSDPERVFSGPERLLSGLAKHQSTLKTLCLASHRLGDPDDGLRNMNSVVLKLQSFTALREIELPTLWMVDVLYHQEQQWPNLERHEMESPFPATLEKLVLQHWAIHHQPQETLLSVLRNLTMICPRSLPALRQIVVEACGGDTGDREFPTELELQELQKFLFVKRQFEELGIQLDLEPFFNKHMLPQVHATWNTAYDKLLITLGSKNLLDFRAPSSAQ